MLFPHGSEKRLATPKTRHFSLEPRPQLIPKASESEAKDSSKQGGALRSAKSVGQKRKRSETAEEQSSASSTPIPPVVRRSDRRMTRNIPAGAYREQDEDDERDLGDEEQLASPGEANSEGKF